MRFKRKSKLTLHLQFLFDSSKPRIFWLIDLETLNGIFAVSLRVMRTLDCYFVFITVFVIFLTRKTNSLRLSSYLTCYHTTATEKTGDLWRDKACTRSSAC